MPMGSAINEGKGFNLLYNTTVTPLFLLTLLAVVAVAVADAAVVAHLPVLNAVDTRLQCVCVCVCLHVCSDVPLGCVQRKRERERE